MDSQPPASAWSRVAQVLLVFLKLGATGFGGPAVTTAMIQDETVNRRKWLAPQDFLDVLGVTNLIPGPNATELAIYVGYRYAGWMGLIAGGVGFILPGAIISGVLGVFYKRYGTLPALEPFLYGIKPAVLSVIALALWRMGAKAVRGRTLAIIGLLALAANLLGANEIVSLFGAGLVGAFLLKKTTPTVVPPATKKNLGLALPLTPLVGWPLVGVTGASVNLWDLGLFFLKVGALLYGSGYVLIAFLQGGLVEQFGWMTQPQLLDAIAVGQFTPGPLASTATFIGYLLAGAPGAVLATLGMFLPSFIIVALILPFVPRLRRSAWMSRFLDAVTVSSLGLMAAVAIKLGVSVLISWQAVLIALVAGAVAWRFKVNSAWLVLGGSLLGWALLRTG